MIDDAADAIEPEPATASPAPRPQGPRRPPIVEVEGSPWSNAPGAGILKLDLAGTLLLLAVTVVASLWENDATDLANLVVSGVLFLGGCLAFAVGFLRGVGRSREEVVDMAGLFYLTGSGPKAVRRVLLGLWFAQIAIAVASVATVQPPFAMLAWLWGIGLLPVWGSRHGVFPPRPLPDGPGRRSRPQ
ncbi:hypothetical protein KSP35_05755 [Aquihabitans sp. G128]|uniref:hypothetical protein n=1 Tax=Aquihabitans sp. G128 TaxID=2849779 RepID=UPI001C24A29D|nr:hypothetical protein [Aquihabitans sp. G128]QXC62309.1 hypothetical protein KSP35_05755 [Aquihabitans sp. G128]